MNADEVERLGAALAGRYVLERELGRGGMATVFLAQDVRHDRHVALKVLHPELAPALGPERFSREIRTAARLTHPHVLPVHDSGEAAGLLWYVMPYVEGESLRERLRREGQLPLEDALQIAREVADALGYAHAHGVVHRDVKPENILLSGAHALLADFGIARVVDEAAAERLTATGMAVGTPTYMSPEQAAGERRLDARSDVYALGSVLYEMLAGEPPFTGPTAQAITARRLTEPAPSVRRLRPSVPPAVERALLTALAPVPADRFATCAAFAEALGPPSISGPQAVPRAADGRSVAVLPFRSLGGDPENELFADGITEDVIANLSRIRSLKVISRASVMTFKQRDQSPREIGARLGVATLLDGSVRRAGGRVRIVAQLLDAEGDRHLWAETYDRDLTDIFAIQTDVALQIAAALKAELSRDERARLHREPTKDLEAYRLYLQGRHFVSRFTEEGLRLGIEYFERALARDPTYALPLVGIAHAYVEFGVGVGGTVSAGEALRRAREAATKALELDPDLGEARSILGFLRCVYEFDWAGAEEQLKAAIELSPGNADAYDFYGWLCTALERYEEAIALLKRAQELDPLVHPSDVGTALLRAGRYEEARQVAARLVAFDPRSIRGHSTLGWVHLLTGRAEEGLAELEEAVRLSSENTLFLAQLGQAYGMTGRLDRAREVLRQLEEIAARRYVSPYHMAYLYVGLGDHERAMDFLERAYEERTGGLFGVKGSFLFRPLRSHPRFQALLRKMNLA